MIEANNHSHFFTVNYNIWFSMVNLFCVPGVKPKWSRCTAFSKYHCFALDKDFVKDLCLSIHGGCLCCLLDVSVSTSVIRLKLASAIFLKGFV